jgi:hypothetical protein
MHKIHGTDNNDTVGLFAATLPWLVMNIIPLWKHPQEWTDLDWRLVCFVLPYMFLLAILKNRASHHQKLYRRQMPDKDFEISKRLRAYLSELFCFRAKMSPVYHPVYSDALMVCFYATVWILFPQPIATAYLWIGFALPLIHEAIAICCGTRFMNENTNLIYNGRRYKCVHNAFRYAKLQDEAQNFLYHPTLDLYGLIPSENSQ